MAPLDLRTLDGVVPDDVSRLAGWVTSSAPAPTAAALDGAGTPDRPGRLGFHLPPELEARTPPEVRGLARDGVRMLVAVTGRRDLVHATVADLPDVLDPGDLLVVNTSGTLPAALAATDDRGRRLAIHLSTRLDDGRWVVEPRRPEGTTTARWRGDPPGPDLGLDGGAALRLVEPHGDRRRLWVAELRTPGPEAAWIAAHGRPIRYGYVERDWPLAAYQTVVATEPGSAEMPSAARPLTPELVTRLVATGIAVAPILLHTGVASLEADELPYPERVVVPPATARLVEATHRGGGRVVAVGTTVVRALEAAAGPDGAVAPLDGWTDVVITSDRGVRVVDGMLTGWHEPEASHLLMLEAVGGRDLLERSYAAAIAEGYLWHEFGDSHLILRR